MVRLLRLAVSLALFGVACSKPNPPHAGLPADPGFVDVSMTDSRFVHEPGVPAGRVVFTGRNTGKLQHQVTLFQLPEDIPPIDEQLRGPNRLALTPEALFPPVGPRGTGSFAADLVPGRRYALLCTVVDADGRSHAFKGMNSEFRPASSTNGSP